MDLNLALTLNLAIEEILRASPQLALDETPGMQLGMSRGGRPIWGFCFGHGGRRLSLIAGCHADEPVGPAMLERLVSFLAGLAESHPLLQQLSWRIVPHVNPDGEARNAPWTEAPRQGGVYDIALYLRHVLREPPGEDVEFGFPRGPGDTDARPENRAVAEFLAVGGSYDLHATFHGMAWAAGPWFLLERGWAERSLGMRQRLRLKTRQMGYRLHDVDRGGEKGFFRIDEGFSTRPDSRAMVRHFLALGDPASAELFRPSSMEFVRSLGGDPLTLVSEMPLFLLPAEEFSGGNLVYPELINELRRGTTKSLEGTRSLASEAGLLPMPIVDQMRLQLAFLSEALSAVLEAG
jgi:hypothetical protein